MSKTTDISALGEEVRRLAKEGSREQQKSK